MDAVEAAVAIQDAVSSGIAFLDRELYLYGDIDEEMALRFHKGLATLMMPYDDSPIDVFINSAGGDEPSGFAIYDAIRLCPVQVRTIGFGAVMSIAALVFQAGDERALAPNCRMLIHGGSCNLGENVTQAQVIDEAREMESVTEAYARIIAERSGKVSPETVRRWCGGDTYFSAQEALEHGLTDGILPTKKGRP